MVDAGTDQVLGAALMHVHAQEVINLVALAMWHSVTATELRDVRRSRGMRSALASC